MTRITERTRLALIWLGYLGLACRMLVPAGYMPAPLGEGGPVILCHGGLAGQLFGVETRPAETDHHAHHGEAASDSHGTPTHDGDGQHEAWELCPIGSALAAVALTADVQIHVLALTEPAPVFEAPALTTIPVARSYWARAPPAILPA